MKFTHLHTHSEYSVLDGMAPVQDIVDKAKADGQRAIAITDHGRLSGVPEFYTACRKADIRPILGQEFYLCLDHTDRTRTPNVETGKTEGPDTFHLVILARNRQGYELLCELSSIANSPEYFYYRPRIDYELLRGLSTKDRKNLAVSTTCLNGHIPQLIIKGEHKEAKEQLRLMRELFPWFYLELQRHELNFQDPRDQEYDRVTELVNRKLCLWASKYDLPVVITNDCHYINQEQHDTHDIWLALQTGAGWKQHERFRFNGYGYHVKTTREMRETWSSDPTIWTESQRNTQDIVSGIDIRIPEFEQRTWHIPAAPRGENSKGTPADVVRKTCERRLLQLETSGRLAKDIQTYRDRLAYEFRVIFGSKFEDEFLVVKDFIDWAKRAGIRVGPGRGSMAGVLVSWLMGITDVDPLRYDLMFERALNPARPSLPDFDVDFARGRREEVVSYLLARYNQSPYQAQQVGTFARLGPRGTIQRLLKTLGYSMNEAVAASKSLPDSAQIVNLKSSGDLAEILEEDDVHHTIREAISRYKHFKEWCTTIQELVSGLGKHAAGIVIADESLALHRLVPTMMVGKGEGRGEKAIVTQYDMEALKKLGVVKFDILSLDTLDVIQEVCDMIGFDPFEDMVEYNDDAVWETINSGANSGIFQVDGQASRQVVRDLHVESFEDLIAVMALGRGGANQFVTTYRQGRDGGTAQLRRSLPDRRLRRILPQGVVLYQEQVMEIGLQIAGMDHHVVDELKEAIKYKKGDVWDDLKPIFFNGGDYKGGHCVGALHNGCDLNTATAVWDMIFSYRGYGFNRAHAVSYAIIAYQTAYLKTHYPQQFYCALLTHKDARERQGIIEEAKRFFDLRFFPPDVNKSGIGFSPAGKHGIRYGLTAILGVGIKAAEHIMETRPFFGPDDMRETVVKRKCNKRVLELLVRVGAFAKLGTPGDEEIGKTELELLGAYVTTHPLDKYRDDIDRRVRKSVNLKLLDRPTDCGVWIGGLVTGVREITTRKGDKMAFIEITYDGLGKWDVVVFPEKWFEYRHSLFRGKVVVIYGEKQHERNSIVLERLETYVQDAA